ncbi:MAG: DASS family sodium-coupled anion symporter [Saprospiraceae bacterium]|nr:DASS family sodium-coupled anion symporter [Saprospiraceae bacterium]
MDSLNKNSKSRKFENSNSKFATLVLIFLLILLNYLTNPFALNESALRLSCCAILMISFWIFEVLPMPVVALFPLILFPWLGIETLNKTAPHYADPIIFLFMGGFFLALAIEKSNLHKRIALFILTKTGSSLNRILLGFMVSAFCISMWISNTATTLMMYPIALSVIHVLKDQINSKEFRKLQIAVLLSIAYASNIGGISTIIGTPPNTAYVGYVNSELEGSITFVSWFALCFPIAVIILTAMYFSFTRLLFKIDHTPGDEAGAFIENELKALGPWTKAEKRVFVVFCFAALLWITKDLFITYLGWNLSDTGIALFAAMLLFIVPSGKESETSQEQTFVSLLEWKDTTKMAWGILLMFGGGLALAKSLESTGIMQRMGEFISRTAPEHLLLLIFLVTTVSVFLSEVMSNIAQVLVMAPIVTSVAISLNIHPLYLGIPMALGASCAGMLPMGTPPNAIVFASGEIPMRSMLRAGFVINMWSIVIVSLMSYFMISRIL